MGTISDATHNLQVLFGALQTAAAATKSARLKAAVDDFADLFDSAIENPTDVEQGTANDMGDLVQRIHGYAQGSLDSAAISAATDFHNALSQFALDHVPELDWNEAAGMEAGQVQPLSGVKH